MLVPAVEGQRSRGGRQNLIDGVKSLDLRSASGIEAATVAIREFSRRERFTAKKKDALLTAIAERLSLDYPAILSKRILHLLSVEELATLAAEGVDIQLHTHRHHAPKKRDSFMLELDENKNFITRFTKLPHHFSLSRWRVRRLLWTMA